MPTVNVNDLYFELETDGDDNRLTVCKHDQGTRVYLDTVCTDADLREIAKLLLKLISESKPKPRFTYDRALTASEMVAVLQGEGAIHIADLNDNNAEGPMHDKNRVSQQNGDLPETSERPS